MLKRSLFFLLGMLFYCQSISAQNAQLPLADVALPKDEAFKEAVSAGLYVIKQDYVLKSPKSGIEYGNDGKYHFGCAYTIGVMLNKQLLFPARVFNAWLDDVNYVKIDTLNPLKVDSIHFKNIKTKFILPYTKLKTTKNDDNLALIRLQTDSIGFDNIGKATKGRLVEVHQATWTKENEPSAFDLKIIPTNWEIKGENIKPKINVLPNNPNLLAAFLFAEEVKLGNVRIYPVAFWAKNEKSQWQWFLIDNKIENVVSPIKEITKPIKEEPTSNEFLTKIAELKKQVAHIEELTEKLEQKSTKIVKESLDEVFESIKNINAALKNIAKSAKKLK